MSKIPISVFDGKVSDAFKAIVQFHIPLGSNILDVTAGERLLWNDWLDEAKHNYIIDFYDKNGDRSKKSEVKQYDIFSDVPFNRSKYNVLIYDPPYFFGVKKSDDPRKDKYGGYAGTYPDLKNYMYVVSKLGNFLKSDGKIIIKCADQYYVPEKKLYLHHFDWLYVLNKNEFDVIDFYIYRHHRMSPTAFQVKNRQSAVIMHTYFIVAQK